MRQRQRNKTPLPLIETFHPAQNSLLRFLIIPSKRVHQKVRFSSTNNLPGYPDPFLLAFRTFLNLLSRYLRQMHLFQSRSNSSMIPGKSGEKSQILLYGHLFIQGAAILHISCFFADTLQNRLLIRLPPLKMNQFPGVNHIRHYAFFYPDFFSSVCRPCIFLRILMVCIFPLHTAFPHFSAQFSYSIIVSQKPLKPKAFSPICLIHLFRYAVPM